MITASLIEVTSAAISVIVYLTGCGIVAFKSSGVLEGKKTRSSRSSWLRNVQIGALSTILALSAGHVLLLYESLTKHEFTACAEVLGSAVIYTMFASLQWLILVLDLLSAKDVAGHEQYLPWIISLTFAIITSMLSSIQDNRMVLPRADIAIQWARTVTILLLILVTICMRDRTMKNPFLLSKDENDEERRPLIEHNDEQDEFDYDDHQKSVASSPGADPEEDDEDEEKEERRQLRQRKAWEYVSSFRIFIPFVRPEGWQQHALLGATIFNTLLERATKLAQPLMLGAIVADLAKQQFVWQKIVAFVVLRFAASGSGINLIRTLVSYRLTLQMHMNLTNHCYEHIMSLSADYHLNKSTPEVWQILERGYSVVELLNAIFFTILPVIADLLIALIVINKLFGPELCFVVAVTMILFIWVNKITVEKKTKRRRGYIDIWRKQFRHMSETFMHWKTVSEFNQVMREAYRQRTNNKATNDMLLNMRALRTSLEAVQEAVITVGFFIVCFFATRKIAEGGRGEDVSKFVTLVAYWSQIMNPIATLAGSTSEVTDKLVDAEKLMLLLEKKPLITEPPHAQPFVFKGGAITFENVSFSYDGQREVTKNVSFTIEPGQTVAFVGETGGGKSTMFDLLYRFFDPSSGRILVDDQDIRHVQIESYRAILGLVPQNPVLFNVSIMENVRYSNLQATNAQVIEACRAAELHEKILKFPKRYKQKVGELAQKLSGGELQRLAIARAILKDPKILLLDEATSAVDSVTESKIQEKLDMLTRGRTTFVIAHRLSTIRNADKILVVRGGQVVEIGSHDELVVKQGGAYRELWEAQLNIQGNIEAAQPGVK